MIVFDLACVCGFVFEGWFQDRQDFIAQRKADLLVCPKCGGREIQKILSPVHLQCGPEAAGKKVSEPRADNKPEERDARLLKMVQDYVEKNFEDVGAGLAEESLKIHYGVEKPRNIRGVTTEEEEKILKEEGIKLLKIPMPVKDDKIN